MHSLYSKQRTGIQFGIVPRIPLPPKASMHSELAGWAALEATIFPVPRQIDLFRGFPHGRVLIHWLTFHFLKFITLEL
jgi:hypothetical protein